MYTRNSAGHRTRQANHIFYHDLSDGARVNVKIEKNSKGFNYDVTVTGASTVDEALVLVREARMKLDAEYGDNRTAAVAALVAQATGARPAEVEAWIANGDAQGLTAQDVPDLVKEWVEYTGGVA